MRVTRLPGNPLLTVESDPTLGNNVNGPSLLRVPDFISSPLGRYYLYFAHHGGKYIRLAFADRPEGPYTVYTPGTLPLADAYCDGHVASPDVHVDAARQRLVMYYHGADFTGRRQVTRAAVSSDGLHFTALPEVLGLYYWRVFNYRGFYYSVEMSGTVRRSRDPLTGFEDGPDIFADIPFSQRHLAAKVVGDTLHMFFSARETTPEHIQYARCDLRGDWKSWRLEGLRDVLYPETAWEGGDLPMETSETGAVFRRARQLRDPGLFSEDGVDYLLYSIAGEQGLAIARVDGLDDPYGSAPHGNV